MKIKILKSGNRIVVDSQDQELVAALLDAVTFRAREFYHPAISRRKKPVVDVVDYVVGGKDVHGRFSTAFGFYERIVQRLRKAGFSRPELVDYAPPADPTVLEPQWDRLYQDERLVLRPGQDEFLVQFFSHPHGRFSLPTAWGKTFLIGIIGLLLPRAVIHVITKRVPVLEQRIYPELQGMLPDVGLVSGGRKRVGHRIMCYSAMSLHHSSARCDIMIADESHELCSDKISQELARYTYSRNYGLSATHDMRLDQKDFRGEAVFGPVIFERTYAESVEQGLIVPIEVHWRDTIMEQDPCTADMDFTARKRHGIWRNAYRNQLIAEDARAYPEEQVLITVETIDHAMHLKRLLPEFELVYAVNGLEHHKRQRYIRWGCISAQEPLMSQARYRELTTLFERGKLRKAICTTVWNVGVDFRDLQVLVRADAGGSPVNDVQIPGRTSRKGRLTDKQVGIVRDYLDQFNWGFRLKAVNRYKTYRGLQWQQVLPPGRTVAGDRQVREKQRTFKA